MIVVRALDHILYTFTQIKRGRDPGRMAFHTERRSFRVSDWAILGAPRNIGKLPAGRFWKGEICCADDRRRATFPVLRLGRFEGLSIEGGFRI